MRKLLKISSMLRTGQLEKYKNSTLKIDTDHNSDLEELKTLTKINYNNLLIMYLLYKI